MFSWTQTPESFLLHIYVRIILAVPHHVKIWYDTHHYTSTICPDLDLLTGRRLGCLEFQLHFEEVELWKRTSSEFDHRVNILVCLFTSAEALWDWVTLTPSISSDWDCFLLKLTRCAQVFKVPLHSYYNIHTINGLGRWAGIKRWKWSGDASESLKQVSFIHRQE